MNDQRADEPASLTGGGLVRIRLDIAYDGTALHGWARQPHGRTVQADLEEALARVLRRPVSLTVAGRTDAGVHATGQVAHADLPRLLWDDHQSRLVRRLRGVLPVDIAVRSVREVPADFDARFAALARHYVYRLTDDPSGPPPLRRADTVFWPRRLDADAMAVAAAALLGRHDFAAYCRRREGATTIRTLLDLRVRRDGELIELAVSADAFCHSMVRSLVGALTAVGEGRRSPTWPASLLGAAVRSAEVPVVAPGGLTLVAVDYPPDAELAARTLVTRAVRAPVGGPTDPAAASGVGVAEEAAAAAPELLRDRLSAEQRVWVTTLRAEGSPHTTPVWFVFLDDRWWFATAEDAVKARNLRADARVCLALEDGAAPVVAEGRARVHDTAPCDVVAAFAAKYDGWDVRRPERPGVARQIVEVPVTRWLLTGSAQ